MKIAESFVAGEKGKSSLAPRYDTLAYIIEHSYMICKNPCHHVFFPIFLLMAESKSAASSETPSADNQGN